VGTRTLSLVLVAAVLAVCPATAEAVTTIGVTNPTPPPGGFDNQSGCFGPCTYLPFRGASAAFVSPISGTIVRWRISSDSAGAQVRLRVLRPGGGGSFTAVGTSATQTTSGTQVDIFTTNLPIRAGDAIGLDNGSSALLFKKNVPGDFTKSQGTTPSAFLADGSSSTFPQSSNAGYQLQINADVEPATTTGGGGGVVVTVPGAPVITGLAVTPAVLALGARGKIAFSLSEAARYTLSFNQLLPGRKRGARCVLQSRRVNTGRRCTIRRRRGTRTAAGHTGLNRLFFNGRLLGRPLPLGSYELVANAVDSGGRHALTRRTRFRLKAAPRHR